MESFALKWLLIVCDLHILAVGSLYSTGITPLQRYYEPLRLLSPAVGMVMVSHASLSHAQP